MQNTVDGQEMCPLSETAGMPLVGCHADPSHSAKLPSPPVAPQNVTLAHDTALPSSAEGGVDQVPEAYVTSPLSPTAAQNVVVGHDTANGPKPFDPETAVVAPDHVEPLYVKAAPSASTATQKEMLAHETASGANELESIAARADQDDPCQMNTPPLSPVPSSSSPATQNDGFTQDSDAMPAPPESSSSGAVDQVEPFQVRTLYSRNVSVVSSARQKVEDVHETKASSETVSPPGTVSVRGDHEAPL
jgi:hypothetical protein